MANEDCHSLKLYKEASEKLLVYVRQSFVYIKHILAHKMSPILSLPFLQNHFYHQYHSSWLQALIISTKLEQIPSKSWTNEQMARGRTSLPSVLSAKKCPKIAEDEPTEVRQFMAKRSSFSAKLERFRLEFFPIISNFTYFSNNLRKKSWKLYKSNLIGSTRTDSLSPLRTLSCKVHPKGGWPRQVLRDVAIMAEASEGSTDLASLLRTNKVEALHATVFCGPEKFLVWTRLPEDNSSWILK